jgi:hypothetical protein
MPMVLKVFGEALKDEQQMSRAMLASIEVPKVPLKRPHRNIEGAVNVIKTKSGNHGPRKLVNNKMCTCMWPHHTVTQN